MYEGEWAGGVMSGTGVRTYSSGRVTAGRWDNGKLITPLDLRQCATAAEGAAEAALAARRWGGDNRLFDVSLGLHLVCHIVRNR